MMINKEELSHFFSGRYEDLEQLGTAANTTEVEKVVAQYRRVLSSAMDHLRREQGEDSTVHWFTKISEMISLARRVPSYGQRLSVELCEQLDLDLMVASLRRTGDQEEVRSGCSSLVLQVLNTNSSTKDCLLQQGLEEIVCLIRNNKEMNVEQSRVAAGILAALFDHSETMTGRVVELGGLQTLVEECKSEDPHTLRLCARGLASAALHSHSDSQAGMVREHHVPQWLFTLLFNEDPAIKYYACLALATLATNKHVEAEILETDSFKQIRPVLTTLKTTTDFSDDFLFGKSNDWLERLLRLLNSERLECKIIAAFHFAMEAQKRKKDGITGGFEEVQGAMDILKTVACNPNGIASQYAAQALRTFGEDIPYKLSYQVTTWSPEDVKEWIKQIGFSTFAQTFLDSRVDGDILLQISDEMLQKDINMNNGIQQLTNLRKNIDYSGIDPTGLNEFLKLIEPKFCMYTYNMLVTGIDKETLLNPILPHEDHLIECGVDNRIHRIKIMQGIENMQAINSLNVGDSEESLEKTLDIFISYRRSNGSGLASLLKVHLELLTHSVFLDVHGLEAGKFDQSLLQNIRSSRNFLLICSPGAFSRCQGDEKQKDWIHKEVNCALNSDCNIILVQDYNFAMPQPEFLPETMRQITECSGVKWSHTNQENCIKEIVSLLAVEERPDFNGSHHDLLSLQRLSSIRGARSLVPRMRNFFAKSRIKLSSRKQPDLLSPVVEESALSHMFHLPAFHRHSQDSQKGAQPPAESEVSNLDPVKSGRGAGAGASHGTAINKCVAKFKSLLGRNKDKDSELERE